MEPLTNIDIRKLPWPHIVAPNFLPKDLFENINSAIPNKEQTSTEENCIKYNMMYQTDPAFLKSALYKSYFKSSYWLGVHTEEFCDLNRDPNVGCLDTKI